jgi:DNA-binding NtrC family response regulator
MAHVPGRSLLLIDDESAQARLISAMAARAGWKTTAVPDAASALRLIAQGAPADAILIDQGMPGTCCVETIRALTAAQHGAPVVVLTAQSSPELAVAAIRAGASDFLVKPIAPDRLLAALDALGRDGGDGELRPMAEKTGPQLGFEEIVGSAPEFRAALAIAAKAARARVPVLIEGESGVGKEVVAQAIHAASPRAKKPLVVVNCGAIPANLVESELFGHERGAFTGAFERHVGRFQDADGGTLLLDEVGELPFDAQVKLLRVLQTGEVQPIGSRQVRMVDVRVIAATNRTLIDEVAAGRFREDLYYRLNVVPVALPPLRRRTGDIPALARHLLARIGGQPGMRPIGITDEALALLGTYAWPGNVRQLQNALFRAAVLCDGDALTAADFPHIAQKTLAPSPLMPIAGGGITLFEADGHIRALEAIEADVIRLAIGHYRGRMSEVARRLGIGRSTLYRKLGELGIDNAA